MNALEVTEYLLWFGRNRPSYSSGLVVNRPFRQLSHAGRLFQAKVWRRYAMEHDEPPGSLRRRWVEEILRHDRADCLRRCRVNLYLARRARR